jgi:hypothetical protein
LTRMILRVLPLAKMASAEITPRRHHGSFLSLGVVSAICYFEPNICSSEPCGSFAAAGGQR